MSLADYQRSFMRASFAAQPEERDLQWLGERDRFLLYRQMIRGRLLGMVRVAFKESEAHVGRAAFEASFSRFLDREPPRSRLLRDVVAAFGDFARRDRDLLDSAPAYLADLLRFEECKWRVGYVKATFASEGEDGVRALDFAGVLVLNPTLVQLSLDYPVHRVGSDEPIERRPTHLLIYRPPGDDGLRWYAVKPFFAALIERGRSQKEPLAESVRAAAEACGLAVDQALVEQLSSDVTLAVSRGVILGVRDPS